MIKKYSNSKFNILTCLALFLSTLVSGQNFSDNASNYSGSWGNNSNQGTGFGAWVLNFGANTGSFIGNPANNGMGTSGIGTTAFGMFATGNAYFNAYRSINNGIQIGDTFSFSWAMNWDANGGSKGFDLRSGGTTIFNVNNGGSSTITANNINANTAYGTTPMLVTITRTSTIAYSFSMTSRSSGATYTTTIHSSSTIDGFVFYIGNQNNGSGERNMYVNGFSITKPITVADGNWNVGSTWLNSSIPIAGATVNIANNINITNSIETGNLTIQTGASLTLQPTSRLKVNGNITNNAQIIFKSDATGSSAFDSFSGSLSGSGNVQVERYIPAKRAFRFLSPSVTTTTTIRQNWQENGGTAAGLGTHITGGASNGFDVTASNNPSMFTYTNGAWAPVTSTLGVLNAGTPYRLMVRGDRTTDLNTNTPTLTNTTLRAIGNLFTGDFIPILNQDANGFSFIGNPYQAPIDMKAILTASTNMNKDLLYYWDPTINNRGGYVTRTLSTSPAINNVTSNFTEILQPGQAVFLKKENTASAATITISETHKAVTQGVAGVFRTSSTLSDVGMIRVNLQANTDNQWQTIEGALAIFNDDYSWAVTQEDATKMGNLDEEVSFMLDGTALAIAFQNDASNTSTLPIQINKMRHTDYQWTFELDNYNGFTPMLWDEQNQTMTVITNNTVVPFSTTATATDRFKIVFQETMNIDDFSLHVALYPNPGKSNQSFYLSGVTDAKVSMQSLLGQEIPVTTSLNGQTMEVKPETVLSTGVYFVSITQAGKTAQVKWIVE